MSALLRLKTGNGWREVRAMMLTLCEAFVMNVLAGLLASYIYDKLFSRNGK